MEKSELFCWLDALAEAGLICDWHWEFDEKQGGSTAVRYWINGRLYTCEGAIKLVRDFEVNALKPM